MSCHARVGEWVLVYPLPVNPVLTPIHRWELARVLPSFGVGSMVGNQASAGSNSPHFAMCFPNHLAAGAYFSCSFSTFFAVHFGGLFSQIRMRSRMTGKLLEKQNAREK